MTLTKSDLIACIYDQCDLNKAKSTENSGEDVLISGFGKFCIKEKGERRSRNPKTGEDLMLAPRRVVTFKCSTVFKERLNGGSNG